MSHAETSPASTAAESSPHPVGEVIAELRGIRKAYYKPDGSILVEALKGVDLDLHRAEYTAIMGASGSGKSTLMNVLGCLDRPTAGRYRLDGDDVSELDDERLSRIRGRRIGFIFQAFNLISELTIVENVEVPLFYQGVPKAERQQRAIAKLDLVGLGDRLTHRPKELSGGQQQRVACARALAARPAVVFADEPTGNLDARASAEVLGFLRHSVDELGQTGVMVTHDPTAASYAQQVLFLADGRLVGELRSPTSATILRALGELSGTPDQPATR